MKQVSQPQCPIYIVTTGTGRAGKAHLPDKNGDAICGKAGRNQKTVDSETVENYYQKCERCLKIYRER